MTVVAVRDDGALLVDDGGQTYLVVDGSVVPMPVEQAVARGEWEDADPAMPVPEGVAERIAALS